MSDTQVLDRVPSQTRSTKFKGATPDMESRTFTWPTVALILGISIPTLAAIVFLSVNDKPTEAVLTTILALLAGLGVAQHTSTQKDLGAIKQQGNTVVEQTNGRMTAMQEQQDKMIDMIQNLALRIPAPSQMQQTTDGSHIHPDHETPGSVQLGTSRVIRLGFVSD